MSATEAIVVGAGPAGLAAGAALRQKGVSVRLLERTQAVGASWRGHYDRLRLHTERSLSSLPGLPIPPAYGKWVPRDQVIAYLERYAAHHQLDVQLGTTVQRLERREGSGWRLHTSDGELSADFVVWATGYNHTPYLPPWPGLLGYQGSVLHSSAYRNADAFRDRDVLVVGTGNSGAEIAVDLAESGAARVRVAVRTPPNILRREVAGITTQRLGVLLRHVPARLVDPIAALIQRLTIGDLRRYGLAPAPVGPYARAQQGRIAILDVGFVAALKARRIHIVAAVDGFAGNEVLLADGTRVRPEAVIAATGYTRGLSDIIAPLGLLGESGLPLVHGAVTHPSAPGLHFIGYTNPVSGNLRELAIDARRIARAVASARRRRDRHG